MLICLLWRKCEIKISKYIYKEVYFYFLLIPQGTFVHLSGILVTRFRKHGSRSGFLLPTIRVRLSVVGDFRLACVLLTNTV